MGFFDKLRKKKEAKALDLTLEQYDGFLAAQEHRISIDDYRRYLTDFAEAYTLEQFSAWLQLEAAGFEAPQCRRYLEELASRVAIADYSAFLSAEAAGLAPAYCELYAATMKEYMSAADYGQFLQAQKTGITLAKYLRYLKFFREELTLAEYDAYLIAEETGITLDAFKRIMGVQKTEPEIVEMPTPEEIEAPEPDIAEASDPEIAQAPASTAPVTYLSRDFSLVLPAEYIHCADPTVIGTHRAMVAMPERSSQHLANPYSAAESITFLKGRCITSAAEAGRIAAAVGMDNAQILTAREQLNIRYCIKEASTELTVIHALVCTSTMAFPVQFFFHEADRDALRFAREVLLSVRPITGAPVPDGVTYLPGREPERIRRRLNKLFEKLNAAYPDGVIVGLHKNHKKWGETVTELYRLLDYPNCNSFLTAYGYQVTVSDNKGGRRQNDHTGIVAELKNRYAAGPVCTTVEELKLANPDLGPYFHTLQNRANELFGMSLSKYFVQEGILQKTKKGEHP